MNKLEIKLLSENATKPTRANKNDAGLDIYASETLILEPQEKAILKTDVAVNIPEGYVGLLTSRSGVSSKTHLVIETGKIDSGYLGELGINIKNTLVGNNDFGCHSYNIKGEMILDDLTCKAGTYTIFKGDKIAQLVIVPIITPDVVQVDDFNVITKRGDKGFGSTGY